MLDFGGWILDLKIPLAFGSQASYHTPRPQRTRRQRGLHIIFMRYRGDSPEKFTTRAQIAGREQWH